ncbi:type II toxin-antitoxin system death-on-curing family toxin [Acidobacteriia bacterium AH_259_A11_L15]|nr:type II toxin-antitoxin system death-on-curing family toxin [Acidobacteriia bacterium AH_259_A11_L15]
MPGYVYPTVAEALQIHTQLMEEFGGSHGLRDRGRLEAAIFRPQIGYYNSLLEEAAALMEALGNNHAFLDGNKRLSFAVTDVFLRLNGFYIEVDPVAAHKFITEAIARSKFRFSAIHKWLQAHIARLPKG